MYVVFSAMGVVALLLVMVGYLLTLGFARVPPAPRPADGLLFVRELLRDGSVRDEEEHAALSKIGRTAMVNRMFYIAITTLMGGSFAALIGHSIAGWLGINPNILAVVGAILGLKLGYELGKRERASILRAVKLKGSPLLDWDAEMNLHGIQLRFRFDEVAHKVDLALTQSNKISADSVLYRWDRLVGKPDLVYNHVNCQLVMEIKSLAGSGEPVTPDNYASKIRVKDVLQAVIATLTVSGQGNGYWVACTLKYPGANVLIRPLPEHVAWIKREAYRYCKERNCKDVSASDLAGYLEASITEQFSVASLAGEAYHKNIISSEALAF